MKTRFSPMNSAVTSAVPAASEAGSVRSGRFSSSAT